MKKIIILIGIFIITFSFGCQKNHSGKKPSWDTDGLKGKVNILRTFQYKAIDSCGIISKSQMIDNNYGNVLIKYNRNGDWIELNIEVLLLKEIKVGLNYRDLIKKGI
jgi:hypothetical protein